MPRLHHQPPDEPHSASVLHPAIVFCSDPNLRKISSPIDIHNYSKAQEIWQTLEDVLEEIRNRHDFRHSLGISAAQIGIPIRMCVVWTPQRGLIHIANPEIIEASAQIVTEYEGCLSFFDRRGRVGRPYGILARYLQKDLSEKTQAFTSWSARIIQHEIDHMNGILYTDRMRAGEKTISYEDYQILKMAG